MATKSPYRKTEAIAAKISWAGENSGPGLLVVKVGRARLRPASVVTVAKAVTVPSALKTAYLRRRAPTSRQRPTMPLQVIITAAKTVSRASEALLSPPSVIRVTISATSMTVTATASTSDPNGSPTRCATTSAWCTAASTAPARKHATRATSPAGSERPQVSASSTTASSGISADQRSRGRRARRIMPSTFSEVAGRRPSGYFPLPASTWRWRRA